MTEDYKDGLVTNLSAWGYFTLVFKRYFDFNGRSRRSEYWYFALINVIISIVLQILSAIAVSSESSGFAMLIAFLIAVYGLATIIPSLAVGVRRLHDIGKSGLNILWGLIPLVGAILLLVWFARDGEINTNKWGVNPKGTAE